MGTPEFAVATLDSLIKNDFKVVGVLTAPDRPAGRGRNIRKSAVKAFAESKGLLIMQPENLKGQELTGSLKNLHADIFIVVGFRMLPEVIWKIPAIGTFNLHASLLPHYRGAAPINHAVMNGETITGVTTFFIDDKIDTGNILLRDEVPISPFENAGDIHDKLMDQGARLVIRTLEGLSEHKIKPQPQSNYIKPGEALKLAPKIFPEDCIINWNNDPVKIHNFIRGLAPYPCARSFFQKDSSRQSFRIFESLPEFENHTFSPGQIISDGKHSLRIACTNGYISIVSLQLEGKKRMNTAELLRGFRITDYTIPVN